MSTDYPFSRRRFLRLAALAAVSVTALAGCRAAPVPAAPTDTPAPPILTSTPSPTPVPPTETPAPPTATLLPTDTPTTRPSATPVATPTSSLVLRRPPILLTAADKPSTVVHARHSGVWDGDKLVPAVLGQLLDAAITRLTGLNDVKEAWAALFAPSERVCIKVGTISSSRFWTKAPLVMAVTERLQAIGMPAENITIWDRLWSELRGAGYTLNESGKGVAVLSTDGKYVGTWRIGDLNCRLSPHLLSSHALINMPVLKDHSITGFTFALKNHYGTFDIPELCHGRRADTALPELNALGPIKERTRLVIGDMLTVCPGDWGKGVKGDGILMSYDPVATDTIARDRLSEVQAAEKVNTKRSIEYSDPWLNGAAKLGLGTNDKAKIQLAELKLA